MAADELFILYSDEKLAKGVSWCTDHESVIVFWKFSKLKMADPIQRPKYFFSYPDGKLDKWVSWGADHESGIEFLPFQKLKMVDLIWLPINCLFYILMKNWSRGFLGALITNLSSNFGNFEN